MKKSKALKTRKHGGFKLAGLLSRSKSPLSSQPTPQRSSAPSSNGLQYQFRNDLVSNERSRALKIHNLKQELQRKRPTIELPSLKNSQFTQEEYIEALEELLEKYT